MFSRHSRAWDELMTWAETGLSLGPFDPCWPALEGQLDPILAKSDAALGAGDWKGFRQHQEEAKNLLRTYAETSLRR